MKNLDCHKHSVEEIIHMIEEGEYLENETHESKAMLHCWLTRYVKLRTVFEAVKSEIAELSYIL